MLTEQQESIIDSIKKQFEQLNVTSTKKGKYIDIGQIVSNYDKLLKQKEEARINNEQVHKSMQELMQKYADEVWAEIDDLGLQCTWEPFTGAYKRPCYKLVITHKYAPDLKEFEIYVGHKHTIDRTFGGEVVFQNMDAIYFSFYRFLDILCFRSLEEVLTSRQFLSGVTNLYREGYHIQNK